RLRRRARRRRTARRAARRDPLAPAAGSVGRNHHSFDRKESVMKITLEFVGLFLFNRLDQEKRVTAAVVHADRDASHGGRPLRPHKAYFKVLAGEGEPLIVEWPDDGGQYDLTGNISFAVEGAIDVEKKKWALPGLASGCSGIQIPVGFFD